MPQLSVPVDHRKILLSLAQRSPEELDDVIAGLDFVDASMESVLAFLEDRLGEQTARILLMLETSRLVYGYTAQEAWAAVEQFSDEKVEDNSRVIRLLENNTIISTAKAGDLLQSTPAQFRISKIITDFRPIFSEDLSGDVSSGVLMHSLKLLYSSFNETKELYLTLDLDDLRKLQADINRALKKHQDLMKFAERSGVSIINDTEE